MKRLMLSDAERPTLRDMGIFHPHPRTRMCAQGIFRLSQGLTLQETADEFSVHLNSVAQWRQRWNKLGLAGLYEGRHTGRLRKWTPQQQQALGELAHSEGGTIAALLRHLKQHHDHVSISDGTAARYLKDMKFSYKRYRYSLKKNATRMRSSAPARSSRLWAGSTMSNGANCCTSTSQVSARSLFAIRLEPNR